MTSAFVFPGFHWFFLVPDASGLIPHDGDDGVLSSPCPGYLGNELSWAQVWAGDIQVCEELCGDPEPHRPGGDGVLT